jgi:hypothetical protein
MRSFRFLFKVNTDLNTNKYKKPTIQAPHKNSDVIMNFSFEFMLEDEDISLGKHTPLAKILLFKLK